MKRAFSASILFLLLFCLLTGCGCKHEWAEATCDAPKTCAKCGETEGEPAGHNWIDATCASPRTCSGCALTEGESLGHSWIDATCNTPEICAACGETQGAPLGHSYGNWILNTQTETMTHQCTRCAEEETVPADYTRLLEDALQGHWDFAQAISAGRSINAYSQSDFLGVYANFREDHCVDVYVNTPETHLELAWEVSAYSNEDGRPLISFILFEDVEGSEEIKAELIGLYYLPTGDNSDGSLILSTGSDHYLLTTNRSIAQAFEGVWVGSLNGQLCTLELSPDRTFTANLGKAISGTWHIKPEYTSGDYTYCELDLCYQEDGAFRFITDTITTASPYYSSSKAEIIESNGLSFSIDGTYTNLMLMDEQEVAQLEAALAEGKQLLVGPWTSSRISRYKDGANKETKAEDYHITFAEDGTFTAMLDQERAGTWSFEKADTQYNTRYTYSLQFDGIDNAVSFTLSSDEFSFSKYDPQTGTTISLYFQQMTPEKIAQREAEQKEAAAQIKGDWNALYMIEYSNETNGENTYRSALDYTIQFKEDGTFAATLDRELTGTWSLRKIYTNENSASKSYYYDLQPDGEDTVLEVSIYADSQMSIPLSSAEGRQSLYLCRLTATERETLK